MSQQADVRVEVSRMEGVSTRQIGPRDLRLTEQLATRQDDIREAVSMAAQMMSEAVETKSHEPNSWMVDKLEAKFGITLAAEAGVILSRASAEASFEITLSISRS